MSSLTTVLENYERDAHARITSLLEIVKPIANDASRIIVDYAEDILEIIDMMRTRRFALYLNSVGVIRITTPSPDLDECRGLYALVWGDSAEMKIDTEEAMYRAIASTRQKFIDTMHENPVHEPGRLMWDLANHSSIIISLYIKDVKYK